jgi:hypothetical protein
LKKGAQPRLVLHTTDLGDTVLCDVCNEDYTHNPRQGGIVFSNMAVCPKCTPTFLLSVDKYNEQEFITDRCPSDVSFALWVQRDIRLGSPASITVIAITNDTKSV